MKTARKAILTVLCVCLVVLASVMGTLAYLTDDDAVVNTFTVGDVQITLDEEDVDNSTEGENDRDQANEYHLLPGITHTKDPQVHILPDSEASYVRMIVTVEGIDDLKAAIKEYVVNDVFLLQNLTVDANGNMTWDEANWPCVRATADGIYEFRYKDIVSKNEGTVPVDLEKLFTAITVPGDLVDNAELAKLENVKIHVKAHAIQSAGFANADAAWAAFDAQNPNA